MTQDSATGNMDLALLQLWVVEGRYVVRASVTDPDDGTKHELELQDVSFEVASALMTAMTSLTRSLHGIGESLRAVERMKSRPDGGLADTPSKTG